MKKKTPDRVFVRFIRAEGEKYLRQEDVVLFIRNLAVGEETDVRNRINQGAEIRQRL